MSKHHPPKPGPKMAAEVKDVKEVTLLGTADHAFWEALLRKEGLSPANHEGRAQIMLVATDARFMGKRFQELAISVVVDQHAGEPVPGSYYLAHAFNSSGLFAFVERRMFHTPYYRARIDLQAEAPAGFSLSQSGAALIRAQIGADAQSAGRMPDEREDEGWNGAIYLPRLDPGELPGNWLFVAAIRGASRTFPFDPERDTWSVTPSEQAPILGQLVDSGFTPTEWKVRTQATHAKSKTMARTAYQRTEPRRLGPATARLRAGTHPFQ